MTVGGSSPGGTASSTSLARSIEVGGKRVGFLELFFDLVFVFAVTQLVGLLHDDHSAAGWGRAGLVLWLVWWAWSQYTWAANAIDLERRATRVVVLVVTGAMLLAATAIPVAFTGDGLWFAVPYVAVRLLGLGLYWFGLRHDRRHQAALRTYVPVALVSPALVLAGGVAGGDATAWWWTAALLVDVISVLAAGRGEFRVDPSHFAERHGLIVIIALGESVIAIGATAAGLGLTGSEATLLVAGFAVVAALWWGYFDRMQGSAERRLATEPDHRRRAHLARDLFTLGHLPIVAGTVVFAVGIEEALLHPADPLPGFAVTALAVGPALYFGALVLGILRATGSVSLPHVGGVVAVLAWVLVAGPALAATVTVAGLAAVVAGAVTLAPAGAMPTEA